MSRSSPARRTRSARRSSSSGARELEVVLARPQVAAQAEHVVQLVRRLRGVAPQLPLDLVEGVAVEQVAQLLLAEQLAQQVAVERQRLRTPLGGRRVVLVHVRRDVVEEKRRAVRRRADRVSTSTKSICARLQPVEEPLQRRQVEHVLEALAVGLEHDRERAVPARDLQQRLRLQPLLPERRPLAGAPPRDQQRARRVLAEARAEERRLADLGDDEILDLGRVDEQLLRRRRRVRVGQVERDAVVRPDRLRVDAERLAQPRRDRHRPRRVHAAAERRQDADAPVADLVAEALDDDRPVARDGAGRVRLLAQEREQVPRGALLERVLVRAGRATAVASSSADKLARGAADLLRRARTAGRPPRPSRTARRPAPPGPARRGRGRA